MQIGMLGPFEVRTADGGFADVPGARLRALLIALALEPGRVAPRRLLADWIWGEHPPSDAANALQRLVFRLRKALPDGAVDGHPNGYRLRAEPDAVDAVPFERLIGQARDDNDPSRLREALALWRGAAMQDVGRSDSATSDAAVTRLAGLRLTAMEDRSDTAHGKNKVYRYYTCFTRNRYDSDKCNATRINADAVEPAVLASLSSFYRDHYRLIADAIIRAQAQHMAGEDHQRAELAAAEAELNQANQAIDRYLSAFENGKLEEDDLASRLADLKIKTKQLRNRRDELLGELADAPQPLPEADLRQVADHISAIIATGTDTQRKALVETLIAEVKITARDRIVPVFRIPQPRSEDLPVNANRALTKEKSLVRGPAGRCSCND